MKSKFNIQHSKIPAGIYPVITTKFCRNGDPVKTLKGVLAGGAKIVQLREKHMMKKEFLALAKQFRVLTKKAGAKLIINDHVDIALLVKADGVHLGQDDLPCVEAKKILKNSNKKIFVGVSTHNLKEAIQAQKDGADYINIGPVFSTKTKETGFEPLGIEKVLKIKEKIRIPFSVMGGIKKRHISLLASKGVRRIAMVTEITKAKNISATVKDLASKIKKKSC